MSTELLSFYNRILPLASLTSDVEGYVRENLGKARKPWTIGGKQVILPTDAQLRNKDSVDLPVFHPLQESSMRGESDVVQQYRHAFNITLNMRLGLALDDIMELACSPKSHGQLRPSHLEMIEALKDVDEKTFEDWINLRKAMPPGNVERCMVHVFIKKNPEIGGRMYKRGAIVSFPLYEELSKEGAKSAFDVKLRKKDIAAFKKLFETLFPEIGVKGSYSRGSSNQLAAILDSLLKAAQCLCGQINNIVNTFSDVIPDLSELAYEDDWVDDANDLDRFEKALYMIPAQRGNEGATARQEMQKEAAAAVTVTTAAAPPTGVFPVTSFSPIASSTPTTEATSDGKVSMSSIMNANPTMQAYTNYGVGVGMFGNSFQPLVGAAAARARPPSWADPMNQFSGTQTGF